MSVRTRERDPAAVRFAVIFDVYRVDQRIGGRSWPDIAGDYDRAVVPRGQWCFLGTASVAVDVAVGDRVGVFTGTSTSPKQIAQNVVRDRPRVHRDDTRVLDGNRPTGGVADLGQLGSGLGHLNAAGPDTEELEVLHLGLERYRRDSERDDSLEA